MLKKHKMMTALWCNKSTKLDIGFNIFFVKWQQYLNLKVF